MRVAVIGAGIIGASFAHHLAVAGAQTLLFDSGRPAGATSTATAAYLNHLRKVPDNYSQLHLQAIDYWQVLAAKLDAEQALHLDGILYWADHEPDWQKLEQLAQRARNWGRAVERVELATIEPALVAPYPEAPYRVAGEGWIEVAPIIERLIATGREHGLQTHFQQPVTAIERTAHGLRVYSGAETFEVDQVVLAAGPDTRKLGQLLGVELPVRRKPGIIAVTAPQTETLRHVLMSPGFSCRPDSGGRLLISVGERYVPSDGHLSASAREELSSTLRALLAHWLPGTRDVPIEALRVGIRPIPEDELPLVGPLPGDARIYLAVSHSAINLGPLFARLGSEEILSGTRHGALSPFRPERLLSPSLAACGDAQHE